MIDSTSTPNPSVKKTKRLYRLAALLCIIAGAILAGAGWGYWHHVRSDPQRTLYGAIENNLRTQGVSRAVTQTGAGQDVMQFVHVNTSGKQLARGSTLIKQSGDAPLEVRTETLSSPTEDYIRYTHIQTSQKKADGSKLDFSSLLNTWGKSSAENAGQPVGELFNESVLGAVPLSNLAADARTSLMQKVRADNIYSYDQGAVERKLENGRPVYVYDISVKPEAYVGLLKQFGRDVGLAQLEAIDPASYKDAEPLRFKMSVDVWSRSITSIQYGQERTEKFSQYGVYEDTKPPANSIPIDELQSKLQQLQ